MCVCVCVCEESGDWEESLLLGEIPKFLGEAPEYSAWHI